MGGGGERRRRQPGAGCTETLRKTPKFWQRPEGLGGGTPGCSSGKDQTTAAVGATASAGPRGTGDARAPLGARGFILTCRGADPAQLGERCPCTVLPQRKPDLLRPEAPPPRRRIPAAAAQPAASPLPRRRAGRLGQRPLPAGCRRCGGCPAGRGTVLVHWPWCLAGGLGAGGQPRVPAAIPAGQAGRAGVGWRIRGYFCNRAAGFLPCCFFFFFPIFSCLANAKGSKEGWERRGLRAEPPPCPGAPSRRWPHRCPGAACERLRHVPGAHCSGLGFSRELFSFLSVFLMRRAVRRARGLWYQHSFMTFASADSTWGRHEKRGGKWERFVASEGLDGVERGCPPQGSPGRRRAGWGSQGSAGRRTPPSSCPRSWGRWGRRRRRAAGSPPRCLREGAAGGHVTACPGRPTPRTHVLPWGARVAPGVVGVIYPAAPG